MSDAFVTLCPYYTEQTNVIKNRILSLNNGEPCVSLLSVTTATVPAASFSGEGTAEPMALSDEEFGAFMNGVLEKVGTWANDMAETFSGAAQQAN